MNNFRRELAKSNKRTSSYTITHPFSRLLEGKFDLSNTSLDDRVHKENGFEFSLSFISTLKGDINLDNFYVIDGTQYWFEKYNLKSGAELLRSPNLLRVMYNIEVDIYGGIAIMENPWLYCSFNYYNYRTNTSLCKTVTNVVTDIDRLCQEYLSQDFIPFGIWGCDILLRYKYDTMPNAELLRLGDLTMISAYEYLRRVT